MRIIFENIKSILSDLEWLKTIKLENNQSTRLTQMNQVDYPTIYVGFSKEAWNPLLRKWRWKALPFTIRLEVESYKDIEDTWFEIEDYRNQIVDKLLVGFTHSDRFSATNYVLTDEVIGDFEDNLMSYELDFMVNITEKRSEIIGTVSSIDVDFIMRRYSVAWTENDSFIVSDANVGNNYLYIVRSGLNIIAEGGGLVNNSQFTINVDLSLFTGLIVVEYWELDGIGSPQVIVSDTKIVGTSIFDNTFDFTFG
jgi:hypothetical protein